MKFQLFLKYFLIGFFISLFLNSPVFSGQLREYLIFGYVVDNNKAPIAKVIITMRDEENNRNYKFKTNKKGKFKFVGLTHGIYQVTVVKEGYQTKKLEWKFESRRHQMQKVDLGTIVMLSDTQLEQINFGKKMQADFKEAKEKIAREDYDAALTILEGMLKESPDEYSVLFLYGECKLKKKSYDDAIPALTKVTEIKPDFPGTYFKLGVCYQKKGDQEKAKEYYLKTLEFEPKNLACLCNLGTILYNMNQSSEAIPYFERALEIRADDYQILKMISLGYVQKEEYAKALAYLEKALPLCTDQEELKSVQVIVDELKKQTKK